MLFFDPSFLVVAEASDNTTPAAEVEKQPAKKRAAPFNPKTGPGSKQENGPLPPPPDKTTAPRGVDEAGSPTTVEPPATAEPPQPPPGVTERIPQVNDDEDPQPRAKLGADEREPALPPTDQGRSPWGSGSSGVR
ncbi:MAG TPA: hypothetical protein VFH73_26845 [Polyangia bacterium]|jgi:hypothetical protein|nr:hypothetical protein [Polyangia bacterium]